MKSQFPINLQYVDLLNEWDPFELKDGSYDTEIADTIQAVHELNDPMKLANRIQGIYEFSFEQIIPLESCSAVAKQLLSIKESSSCTL